MSLTDKFDRNRRIGKSKAGSENVTEQSEIENFAKAGPMRFISFIMADGKREFFSYADLTHCSFDPEESKIVLDFRGLCAVTLKGQNMLLLYEQLQNQFPRQIACVDTRYQELKPNHIFVNDITITQI